MAEQEQQNPHNQAANNKPKIYTLKNDKLAANIDKLFFQWFDDRTYDLRKNDEENINTTDSLDSLAQQVRRLQTELVTDKSKEASELKDKLADFLGGNANAATEILNDRPKEDHISKLLWLINSITTVSVLSGELAESGKPLQHGPLKSQNVTSQNIEQVMIPNVRNSRQMKTASEFLNKVLPKTFAAIAKHKNLVKAAATRAAVTGNEYHNQPTMDSMYRDLGEALIFVSTAFYVEANRAFTETGKRIAADRMKNLDFSKLSAENQDKLMQLLRSAFRQYANLTASANTFSSINDKIMMDAAYAAWYSDMNEQEKKASGFNDKNLMQMTYVRAFARKYRNLYERHYTRYSNLFVDGMTAALKKEQETVKKDWFENKITGERVFRRGRLAGHGAKFMHTGPMEWLDKKLSEKKKASLWIFPKLAFGTLKIMTNPTLHKARKKLTGALFAGLRSFAQGVHEGFTKTGQSTEITYEDVIKKLKEATDKINSIKDDKAVITNESIKLSERSSFFTDTTDSIQDDVSNSESGDEQQLTDKLKKYLEVFSKCKELSNNASSDEAVNKDKTDYVQYWRKVDDKAKEANLSDKLDELISNDTSASKELVELAKEVKTAYTEFTETHNEYLQKNKDDFASNAQDYKSSGNTLQVGEQAVQICEDVFATLNKYIARQWNLLAVHSDHEDMPLCAEYTWIDTPEEVKGAAKPKQTSEMTLTDWLADKTLFEAEENLEDHEETDNERKKRIKNTAKQRKASPNYIDAKNRRDDVRQADDRARRDRRAYLQGNDGSNTADYPKKYNEKYRYHGLMLAASSVDKSKNGFGIFADRLMKIAEPVHDFCTTVEFVGNETSRKTFNNDKRKDESVKLTEIKAIDALDKGIGNAIVQQADKAKDWAANKTKSGINKVGTGAGHALGSLVHGITRSSTADKDRELAKTVEDYTGFVYSYNKSLKLSYVRDGARILSKHCLTNIAKQSFNDIATLATALIESNIANAHSIKAVSDSLQMFVEQAKSAKFAPCKTVIDWQFADIINKGGINDKIDSGSCMIKGIRIKNFDSAKEYVSDFTHKDVRDLQKRGMKDVVIPRAKWDNMTADQRRAAFTNAAANSYNHVPYDENNKPYSEDEIGESLDVKSITDLSMLYEQFNSIDWKEVFNG